jgi:hypothetical protein
MLNYTSAEMNEIIVHYVGNRNQNEDCIISKRPIKNIDIELKGILINYFLSPYRDKEYYEFWHHSSLSQNDIFAFVSDIFLNDNTFIANSKNIAQSLYEASNHPNIKAGELCIVKFSKVIIDDRAVECIGIFKSENKETFIKFNKEENNNYSISEDSGVGLNKIEKGCLIFNIDKKSGYRVASIDNTNRANAVYWNDTFLKLKPKVDEFHQTSNFLHITKNYITKQLPEEFEVTKTDQIVLLNRSVEYFKENEVFDKKKFEKQVFQESELIKSFRTFDEGYREEKEIVIADEFDISAMAVKKQGKVFKSVLKLDRNFHIYIHGDKDLIQKGTEKDGRKFYKIYYEEEK